MRYIFIYIFFIFTFSNLFAQEAEEQPSQISILISKIKSAKASEKRLLINQLKIQLRELNKESQVEVMEELRRSFNTNMNSRDINTHQKNEVHNFQKQNIQHNYSQQKGKR